LARCGLRYLEQRNQPPAERRRGCRHQSPTDFIGGIHAGYDYQFNSNIVLGLEGEMDDTVLSKTEIFPDGSNTSFKSEWQGSVRARLGYTFGQFLPSATVGVAGGIIC